MAFSGNPCPTFVSRAMSCKGGEIAAGHRGGLKSAEAVVGFVVADDVELHFINPSS